VVTRFVVIGDATLDIAVAPARPPRTGGDVPAVIHLGPGGQGANVAVRLARRGAEVGLVASIGRDAAGRLITEALEADGVEIMASAAPRSATVVALLEPGGERSMLSDRQALSPDPVGPALAGASWIHVSAYALLGLQEGDALAARLAGRAGTARLSVAGGSIAPDPVVVAGFRARLASTRPDLLVANADEAASLLGAAPATAGEAARRLAGLAPLVVVTAAGQGSVAINGETLVEVRAADLDGPALDATGSGDAYLAALIGELADGPWPPAAADLREAMERGSLAGARAARVIGAQTRIDGEPPPGGAA
jgi:sugar/nucleoside kinase (ribokinase family)